MEIHYVDLENIPKKLRQPIDENVKKFLKKFNSKEAKIHVKRFNKEGKKHRFEVHTHTVIDDQVFIAKSEEWDCNLAIKETLNAIKAQHEKFKLSHPEAIV